MTDPRPCCFRWAHRTIVLACLAIVLTAAPRALGQAPAAPKPSPPSTANRQERLKDRDRLAKEVEQLKTHGKLLDAIKAAEAMLAIEHEVLGETSEDAIGSLEVLARLHQDREDWAEAKKARSEVLELREKTLGKDHWKVTDARSALANVERSSRMDAAVRRRLAAAEKLDQKVEELFGQGKYSEAIVIAREEATLRKEIQGERHPDYAQSLNNLAVLLDTQGDYAAARPLYEQALAIRKAVLGERHPDYATSLNNLAVLLESQGDYAAARPLYEQALAITQGGAGRAPPRLRHQPEQPGGAARSRRGTTPPPGPSTSRRWRSRKAVLGERHPDYALSLNNLAALLESQGDYAAARPLFEQALAIRKAVLGERHPDYATSLNNLAAAAAVPGGLRRCPAPLRAGAGDPQGGAGRAPPRLRHQPEQPGVCCCSRRGTTPAPGPSSSRRWRSARRCWAKHTPTTPGAWSSLRNWLNRRETSPRPDSSSNRLSTSPKNS